MTWSPTAHKRLGPAVWTTSQVARCPLSAGTDAGTSTRRLRYHLWMAHAWRLKGNAVVARGEYQYVLAEATRLSQSGVPSNLLEDILADGHAGVGNQQQALASIERGLKVIGADSKESPVTLRNKAAILAQFGQHDAAIAELTRLLEMPYGVTPAELRLNPLLDPLRKDPRFRRLSSEG